MTFEEQLGMPYSPLGLPISSSAQQESSSEDRMLLPIEVRMNNHKQWWEAKVTRDLLAPLLNGDKLTLGGEGIDEICLCSMEGEDCSMRYIYSFQTKQWRFE